MNIIEKIHTNINTTGLQGCLQEVPAGRALGAAETVVSPVTAVHKAAALINAALSGKIKKDSIVITKKLF